VYIDTEAKNKGNEMKSQPERRKCTRRSMSETRRSTEDQDESGLTEIRIKGHLDKRWADWFDGLTITLEDNGDTRLTGPVVDQAALHSLLRKVRDLGLPLVSVRHVEPKQADGPPAKP
jgi:hypothetical protein